MKLTAICTICSYNYLSYGINCCESFKQHNEFLDIYLLIVDKKNNEVELLNEDNIHYIYLEDLNIESSVLKEMEFKYNIIEMNTAVKPAFVLYLMNMGYRNVFYFDPDIMCFSSIKTIEDKLSSYDAIVTPHRITPIDNSKLLDDSAFLNNGIYNLGFFAIRNTENGKRLLSWWSEKLKTQAFLDYSNGLATDQIWANFFPVFFDNIYVSKNFGMNVAFWNIEERKITKKNNIFYINDDKLVFFHFSGFSLSENTALKWGIKLSDYPYIDELFVLYKNSVLSKNHGGYSNIKYGFSQYKNGELILPCFRRLYAELKPYCSFDTDPFSVSNNSFYYLFIKKKGRLCLSKNINFDKNKKIYFIVLKIFIFLFGIKKIFSILKIASVLSIKTIAKLYYD